MSILMTPSCCTVRRTLRRTRRCTATSAFPQVRQYLLQRRCEDGRRLRVGWFW
jgi:hypothetical protein